jgi:hypothetical protein
VQQINRNIDLIRSRRYGDDLLLQELANAVLAEPTGNGSDEAAKPSATKSCADCLAQSPVEFEGEVRSPSL